MNEHLPWFPVLFLPYVLSASILCLPFFWWFRSVDWRWWEAALLFVPFLVWFCLMALWSEKGKSLSNVGVEPFLCGCVAFLPLMTKVVASRYRRSPGVGYFLGLLASCAIVLLIYTRMPGLPE